MIQGLTIREGKGTTYYEIASGRIWIAGGGIFVSAGGATIINNRIIQNTLTGKVGAPDVYGAGIAIYPALGALSPWLVKDDFIGYNTAEGHYLEGGGVWCTGTGKFLNNTVINNSATAVNTLGPSYYANGGGIGMGEMANIDIQSNYISKNSCTNEGGGLSCFAVAGSSTVVRFKNNIITENTSQTHAAAIQINSGDYTFVNNTIAGNSGPYALGVGAGTGSLSYRMMNNIIWNPLSSVEFNTTAGVSASYNCARNGLTGTGNIDANPLFIANDSLYHLSNASPCIGTGISFASVGGVALNAPLFDYFNTPRPRAAGSKPDMGAVENDLSSPISFVKDIAELPTSFALEQNYPNPFNPTTTIHYSLPSSAKVKLTIHDILGREIVTLVNEEQSAGWKEVLWNAKDVSSGIYFYKLQAGNFVETKKMIVVK